MQLCLLMQALTTTSHYSLSRLLTRISHLHFTRHCLILHLVRHLFSLKSSDRLRWRKGTTTDSNTQRGCPCPWPRGRSCRGSGWNHHTPMWRARLCKTPWETSMFGDSLKCPKQPFLICLLELLSLQLLQYQCRGPGLLCAGQFCTGL